MDTRSAGPLGGVRILDFSRVLAGPYATRILGDLGAEVIKVQSKRTAQGTESDASAYFRAWNRNKKGITLDLDYPEAREAILGLVKASDVVVENFSPRVMSNWGLTYDRMRDARADIILLSMSAMGQTGPWRDYVGYGQTMQALSGITFMTSWDERSPDGLGQAYADVVAGLYGVVAILAALDHRDRCGAGQHIDLSNHEAMSFLMGPALLELSAGRQRLLPRGAMAEDDEDAPCGCYPCLGNDRWCVIEVTGDAQWQTLCCILGDPEWAGDRKYSTPPLRKRHRQELDRHLSRWTVRRTAEDIVRSLQEVGIPAGVVQDARDLSADPQLTSREFFVRLEHPVYGPEIADNLPLKSCDRFADRWRPAPLLGQDNRYVFMQLLGFSETRMEDYRKRGIIR